MTIDRIIRQSAMESQQFEQAVSSAQQGDRANGYRLMRQVLLADPSYAPAWYWMSRLVDEPARQRECLERALAIDPQLKAARDALRSLRAQERRSARPSALGEREPRKLGEYLIERSLITRNQLEVALLEQRNRRTWGKRVSLGDILIDRGFLTPQVLARVLLIQQRDRLQARGMRPERLGEYLVVCKLVSPEQLEAALAEQSRLRQRGQYVLLGEILVQRTQVQRDILERVLSRQRQDAFGRLSD
jgi:hypothetical protein